MNATWIIAKRELRFNFDSLTAYIVVVGFLLFTGGFTWLSQASNIFSINQANLGVFFSVARWTLFFFIPALTMRMLAEERKAGTIELLLTRPISDWQLVGGKFLSCWIMVALALALTIPYYITVSQLGDIDRLIADERSLYRHWAFCGKFYRQSNCCPAAIPIDWHFLPLGF